MKPAPPDVPIETLRKRKLQATQSLLGDTIGISDDQWGVRTSIPGWTRAHVAAHLARGADALVRVTLAALEGRTVPLYPSAARRFDDIERGTIRSGLDLQIDLDTAAGSLNTCWDAVTDWTLPVDIGSGPMILADLVGGRFREVTLHHLDLAVGFTVDDIEPVPARWLLEYRLSQIDSGGVPAFRLESESGVRADLGAGQPTTVVRGSDARLWGWLNGRVASHLVSGAGEIHLPLAA
jgi:maleylpyruvate isomerase